MGWNLAMQENVEDDMLARAYSYDALGSFVVMPVGASWSSGRSPTPSASRRCSS